MSLFPRIERTCPWLDRLDEAMEGDFCRMCKRDVYDLTGMTDPERASFMAACGGDACVRYTAYVHPAVAAAMVAASMAVLVPEPAMAQRHRPAHKPRHVAQRVVPVMLGGAPPVVVPMVTAGMITPIEPPKPPEPEAITERAPPTKRD